MLCPPCDSCQKQWPFDYSRASCAARHVLQPLSILGFFSDSTVDDDSVNDSRKRSSLPYVLKGTIRNFEETVEMALVFPWHIDRGGVLRLYANVRKPRGPPNEYDMLIGCRHL